MFRCSFESTVLSVSLLLVSTTACAAEGSASVAFSEWREVPHERWQGKVAGPDGIDLSDGLVHTPIEKDLVEGTWLRTSASAPANAADFNVWIHVFDADGRPLALPLPTSCRIAESRKVCANSTWVQPGGTKVRVSFYPGQQPTIITPGLIEQSQSSRVQPDAERRFAALIEDLKRLYYRSKEVDWDRLAGYAARSLRAPSDVDPLPTAISLLISKLPGNTHSFVFRPDGLSGGNAALPECAQLTPDVWRLDLPGTPHDQASAQSYMDRAHKCLSTPNARAWLINLTDNFGGNVFLQFAALAPLLGSGPQMQFTNADGDAVVLHIDGQSVKLGAKTMFSWSSTWSASGKKVAFVLGPGCGSSCEAVAIAVKGRFKTLGQPTTGLATANETLPINDDYALALTAGFMADLRGTHFHTVPPDVELDNESMQRLLKDGVF